MIESLQRSFWKLGCVKQLIIGQVGETRGATIRMVNKKGKTTLMNRPVQLLYPLEIHATEKQDYESTEREMAGFRADGPAHKATRPQYSAAKRGSVL